MRKNKAFSIAEIGVIMLIIAILFAAINEGINLYRKSKLASARNLTQNSPLIYMEGITLWVEATSKNSFDDEEPGNGDVIENWHLIDYKSLNKDTLTQSNADYRPVYSSSEMNGRPGVKFDGNNDLLKKSYLYSELFGTEDLTIFIVQKHDSTDSTTTTFRWITGTKLVGLHAPEGSNIHFDYGDYSVDNYRYSPVATNFSDAVKMITLKKDGASADVRVNGSSIGSNISAFNGAIAPSTSGNLYLGNEKDDGTSTYNFKGLIGEFVIFNKALTDDEINSVEDYLSQKWAI